MHDNVTDYTQKSDSRKRPWITVFFAFCLISLLAVTGFYWTGPPSAAALGTESRPMISAVPGTFADLAETLGPTVVNIRATKIEKVRGFHGNNMPEGPFGDLFEHFFRNMPQGPNQRPLQGAGSGVIINSDGTILTNNHVVEGAKDLTVTLSSQAEYKARIVGRDPRTDLAVLKIDAEDKLPAAVMGDSEHLRVGDWVLAIGNPFGLKHTVTSGIVSAKGRIIGAGPYDDFIQTDASINPGNSGGPLFNTQGELVGINTAIIPQGQGIGFAIPVNTARPLIPQMVEHGRVSRGYLGVNIQTVTPDLAEALGIEKQHGALVSNVVTDGPADKAGIQRGDVIFAYNGKDVEDSHALPLMVASTPEGEKATVSLLRNGKEKKIRVRIGALASEHAMVDAGPQAAQGKWGLHLKDLDPRIASRLGLDGESGVVIAGVKPGSPADHAGLRRGDIILEVNRKPVDSTKDAKQMIARTGEKDALLLLVNRDRGSFFVGLKG